MFLLGKYYVTDHALAQYSDRVNFKGSVLNAIKTDLRTLNIRNIVYGELNIHVFTKNSKEFVFARNKRGLCLKTVIKRNVEDTRKTLEKRKYVCNR